MPRPNADPEEGSASTEPEFAVAPVTTRISTYSWAKLEHLANLHGRSTRHEVATAIAYWVASHDAEGRPVSIEPKGGDPFSDPETEALYSRSSAKSSGGPEG